MDQQTLVSGLVTVGVGAVSGGITNAVAIWMLFHPYEPRRLGLLVLHGAIPKNKARLAKSIGRTVGERLLTPEDLALRLAAPEVRATFDGAIDRLLDDLLERERGPLRDELPPEMAAALDETLAGLGARGAAALADWAGSPASAAALRQQLDRLRADIGDRPVGDALGEGRRAELRARLAAWGDRLAEGDELERALRAFVESQLERVAADERPLLARLPPAMVGVVEQAIADYVPVALERLGTLLADPVARYRIEKALRAAFDGSVRELVAHERLLARLVMSGRAVERLLDGLEKDGFERFADSLRSADMRGEVSTAVGQAVHDFLRRPLGERLRRLTPQQRAGLGATLGDWLVRVAREPATRAALARAADRLLDDVERRTWGEALDLVPAERLAAAAGEALATERGRRWVEDAVRRVAASLLARPLGRPAEWLEPEAVARLRAGVRDAAWRSVQAQIPGVVGRLKVEEMVEQKVLGFSTERMEGIVRDVSQRELDLIVRLGYVLGALVGLAAFGINLVLG